MRPRWLGDLWRGQSLRAHITVAATGLFGVAVATGAILLIVIQHAALVRALDSSATAAAQNYARTITGATPAVISVPGADRAQVVDAADRVVSSAPPTDAYRSLLTPDQLTRARAGHRITISSPQADAEEDMRVTAIAVPGGRTVLVAMGLNRVEQNIRILRSAALIGGPIAVLAMGLATYFIVARTLRQVALLRQGAEEITAAGLADQRLPVSNAQDEIHRLAVTLNAMLDRIDASTKRQRTFVGDAAHELRSPIASLRLQLEIAERLGPSTDWPATVQDAMVDVDRLDRLVADLLALARSDESNGLRRSEPVRLDDLVTALVDGYAEAKVPVSADVTPAVVVGDPDGLRRVLVNLIDNAVRYASSSVRVSLAAPRAGGPNRSVELIVVDDGPGIPAAERERVFDRFYRVNADRSRESGGTGLGLPIVRDLVRAHGGMVRLTGNDPGLRAIVTLPLGAQPSE